MSSSSSSVRRKATTATVTSRQPRRRAPFRVRSAHLSRRPAVIVASERMDENPGWTPLACSELLHVAPDLTVHREVVLDGPPAKLISLDDLDPRAAASQRSPQVVPRGGGRMTSSPRTPEHPGCQVRDLVVSRGRTELPGA